jgi:RNA polymerase sigma-70 factor (ECF subfamily)
VATDPSGQTSVQLRAALAGDEASLGWLVQHLSPLLYAQARWRLGGLLGHACDPDDLVQDAWLVALPHLHELQPRDGRATPVLLRFLSTTILNRINNLAKAQLRHGGAVHDAGTTGAATGVAERITGVVTAAVREERRRLVLEAIDALDPIDREVLLLRAVEQRSGRTTAELLRISVDAVAMRYGRARQRLRARLSDSLLGELE